MARDPITARRDEQDQREEEKKDEQEKEGDGDAFFTNIYSSPSPTFVHTAPQ